MTLLNTPATFRLSRLTLAIALALSAQTGAAQETQLDPITVEAQVEKTPVLGASNVDAETVQVLRPATSDTATAARRAGRQPERRRRCFQPAGDSRSGR